MSMPRHEKHLYELEFETQLKNTIWPAEGLQWVRDYTTEQDQRRLGDYELEVIDSGLRFSVESKAVLEAWPDFPYEVLQDLFNRGDDSKPFLGWSYDLQCKFIYYAQLDPGRAWKIRWSQLKDYWYQHAGDYQYRIVTKGYGTTLIAKIPLAEMVRDGVARLLPQLTNRARRGDLFDFTSLL